MFGAAGGVGGVGGVTPGWSMYNNGVQGGGRGGGKGIPVPYVACCMRPAPVVTVSVLSLPIYALCTPCRQDSCFSATVALPGTLCFLLFSPILLILCIPFGLVLDAIICLLWMITCGCAGRCCPWQKDRQGCWMMISDEEEYRPCSFPAFCEMLCGRENKPHRWC